MEITQRLDRIENMLSFITENILISQKEALTTKELSIWLGLSIIRIRNLVCAREIPFYKQGRKLFFKKSEIEQWMLGTRVKTNAELESEAATAYFLKSHKNRGKN